MTFIQFAAVKCWKRQICLVDWMSPSIAAFSSSWVWTRARIFTGEVGGKSEIVLSPRVVWSSQWTRQAVGNRAVAKESFCFFFCLLVLSITSVFQWESMVKDSSLYHNLGSVLIHLPKGFNADRSVVRRSGWWKGISAFLTLSRFHALSVSLWGEKISMWLSAVDGRTGHLELIFTSGTDLSGRLAQYAR